MSIGDREIKICAECCESDMIQLGKSHCDECLEKRRVERKNILSV